MLDGIQVQIGFKEDQGEPGPSAVGLGRGPTGPAASVSRGLKPLRIDLRPAHRGHLLSLTEPSLERAPEYQVYRLVTRYITLYPGDGDNSPPLIERDPGIFHANG